jgi:hypothetical protein
MREQQGRTRQMNGQGSPCPPRALQGRQSRSFTANHGQPKPLRTGSVLRMSCSSQAHDEPRTQHQSPTIAPAQDHRCSHAVCRLAAGRRIQRALPDKAGADERAAEYRVPVVVSSLVSSVYVRLRSSAFEINVAVQVADVNGIQRTVIPTPENRKVRGYLFR